MIAINGGQCAALDHLDFRGAGWLTIDGENLTDESSTVLLGLERFHGRLTTTAGSDLEFHGVTFRAAVHVGVLDGDCDGVIETESADRL